MSTTRNCGQGLARSVDDKGPRFRAVTSKALLGRHAEQENRRQSGLRDNKSAREHRDRCGRLDVPHPSVQSVVRSTMTSPMRLKVLGMQHPVTPDGRYFVVRGRLWRMANPALDVDIRDALVRDLMASRRAVGLALRAGDTAALAVARAEVDRVKRLLGERGPVWWRDGSPDLNRRLVTSTLYAAWHEAFGASKGDST
jgi:hypothetical protein